MAPRITQLSTNGGPGRVYAQNPFVFSMVTVLFPSLDTADEIFVEPSLPNLPRMCVITRNAQKDDVGVALVAEMTNESDGLPFDISQASSLTLKIGYPDGTSEDFTALLYTDGTDGKLYYVTQEGALSEAGICTLQGKVVISGAPISSQVVPFQVNENINDD